MRFRHDPALWLLAAAATAGCVDDVETPPLSGDGRSCSTIGAGDYEMSLEHDGRRRTFRTHVPPGYDGSALPLVIDLHGLGSNAEQQFAISGFAAVADEQRFLLVHPRGIDASWNGGALCCGSAQLGGVDDEGFMRAIVSRMVGEGCVDPARVYATGLSNGGALTHLLGCRAADVFAAIAPVSMGNGTLPCEPSRPISVLLFRGTSDPLVPYAGGSFPSAEADFEQWRTLDGCTGEPEAAAPGCRTTAGCNGGVEVSLCTIDGGHVLYAEAAEQGTPVSSVTWELFRRHRLP